MSRRVNLGTAMPTQKTLGKCANLSQAKILGIFLINGFMTNTIQSIDIIIEVNHLHPPLQLRLTNNKEPQMGGGLYSKCLCK